MNVSCVVLSMHMDFVLVSEPNMQSAMRCLHLHVHAVQCSDRIGLRSDNTNVQATSEQSDTPVMQS